MVGLDKNSLIIGFNNIEVADGVLDDCDGARFVSNEEVFRGGERNFQESVKGLTGSFTVLGDVEYHMGRRKSIIPFVDMCISEADVETVFVKSIFSIKLAIFLASMAIPDGFVRKGEITMSTCNIDVILFEKFASLGQPVVIATYENIFVFMNCKNGATVLPVLDAVTGDINKGSEIFIK